GAARRRERGIDLVVEGDDAGRKAHRGEARALKGMGRYTASMPVPGTTVDLPLLAAYVGHRCAGFAAGSPGRS
ncbi:hypothetical protein, partial [Streptomyces youssoufiensis]